MTNLQFNPNSVENDLFDTFLQGYSCIKCKKNGIKLWRRDNEICNPKELFCAYCAAKDINREIYVLYRNGQLSLVEKDKKFKFLQDELGHPIGYKYPAIPYVLSTENIIYARFGAVSDEGMLWWEELPNQ